MSASHTARAAITLTLVAGLILSCATPRPFTDDERHARSQADLARMFGTPDSFEDEPLDLYTAMARAVRFNMEHRLRLLEEAHASRRLADVKLDMLPRLLASDEYYGRNKENGAVSQSLLTGSESLEASTSQERYGHRGDLTVAWNLIDFGLSWVRAQQEANEVLIARERRAKVQQDLLAEVRRAYWMAVGADALLPEVEQTEADVHSALARSHELEEERLIEPLSGLAYRRSLLTRLKELSELRTELANARIELATLAHVRPGTPLALKAPHIEELSLPPLDVPVEALEQEALVSRPELREEDYRHRISRLEVRRAMLAMLPGVELRVGRGHDTNQFLSNNNWWNYSAVISKNVVEMLTGPSEIGLAQTGVDVAEARRMTLSMAVLAQVHIAHERYGSARKALEVAGGMRDLEGRVADVTRELYDAERESELELIRKSANSTVADLRYWVTYAELQESYGQLLNSVGLDVSLGKQPPTDTAALATGIRRSFDRWRRRVEIARDYPESYVPAHQPPAEPGG